jgi:5-methylcytosine-specific restriction endonuclease McrA
MNRNEYIAAWKRRDRHENPDKVHAQDKAYRDARREALLDYQRQYRDANRETVRAYNRLRTAANPFVVRALQADRRFGEKVHWSVLARVSHLPCFRCGIEPAGGADHVIPFVKQGRNVVENLQPACLPCNQSKGAKVA